MRVSKIWCLINSEPAQVAGRLSAMNTAENPAMNKRVSRVIRLRWWVAPEDASATSKPVITDK